VPAKITNPRGTAPDHPPDLSGTAASGPRCGTPRVSIRPAPALRRRAAAAQRGTAPGRWARWQQLGWR